METVVDTFAALSPHIAGVLVASVWQGMLLTAAVALGLRLVRGIPAAVRTTIWTILLVLTLVLPFVELWGASARSAARTSPASLTGVHVSTMWSEALTAFWLLGSAAWALRLVINGVRLGRVACRALPVEPEERVAALLQGPRPALLCISPEIDRPSVAGFLHPRVLLPEGLLETLSAPELEHVVLHEMEHLRRRDDWLNLLQQLSLLLLPLNPALFWLDRRLCRERELACDDSVLRATGAHKAYAACLVKLAEDSMVRKGLTMALSALGTRARESELVSRVRRILAGPHAGPSTRSLHFARLTAGTATVCLLGAATVLAHSPTLVSFGPAPASVAQAEMPRTVPFITPAAPAAHMLLTAMPVGQPAARPLLTRAVMPAQTEATFAPPRQLRAAVRRKPRLRLLPTTTPVRVPASGTLPVVKASIERDMLSGAAPWRVVSAHSEQIAEAPEARMTVTEFLLPHPDFSSHWAAVPVQGGWLLVQL